MKKAILVSIITMLSVNLFAQTTYEVDFDGGEKHQITFHYNNPFILPKYNISVGIFLVSPRILDDIAPLALNFDFVYRYNQRLSFNAAFNKAMEPGSSSLLMEEYNPNIKFFYNLDVLAHYSLTGTQTENQKEVLLGMVGAKDYVVSMPLKVTHEIVGDFGIYTLRQPSGKPIGDANIIPGYYSGTHNNVSVQYGFSYRSIHSVKLSSEKLGLKKHNYRETRVYLNYTNALINKVDYYQTSDDTDIEVPEAAVNLVNKIKKGSGFRIGVRTITGQTRYKYTKWMSIEYAGLPYISVNNRSLSSKRMITINYGISFANKPRLIRPTQKRNMEL